MKKISDFFHRKPTEAPKQPESPHARDSVDPELSIQEQPKESVRNLLTKKPAKSPKFADSEHAHESMESPISIQQLTKLIDQKIKKHLDHPTEISLLNLKMFLGTILNTLSPAIQNTYISSLSYLEKPTKENLELVSKDSEPSRLLNEHFTTKQKQESDKIKKQEADEKETEELEKELKALQQAGKTAAAKKKAAAEKLQANIRKARNTETPEVEEPSKPRAEEHPQPAKQREDVVQIQNRPASSTVTSQDYRRRQLEVSEAESRAQLEQEYKNLLFQKNATARTIPVPPASTSEPVRAIQKEPQELKPGLGLPAEPQTQLNGNNESGSGSFSSEASDITATEETPPETRITPNEVREELNRNITAQREAYESILPPKIESNNLPKPDDSNPQQQNGAAKVTGLANPSTITEAGVTRLARKPGETKAQNIPNFDMNSGASATVEPSTPVPATRLQKPQKEQENKNQVINLSSLFSESTEKLTDTSIGAESPPETPITSNGTREEFDDLILTSGKAAIVQPSTTLNGGLGGTARPTSRVSENRASETPEFKPASNQEAANELKNQQVKKNMESFLKEIAANEAAQKALEEKQAALKQEAAATKIQTAFRTLRAKIEIEKKLQENTAATKIQAVARGVIARNKLKAEQELAAASKTDSGNGTSPTTAEDDDDIDTGDQLPPTPVAPQQRSGFKLNLNGIGDSNSFGSARPTDRGPKTARNIEQGKKNLQAACKDIGNSTQDEKKEALEFALFLHYTPPELVPYALERFHALSETSKGFSNSNDLSLAAQIATQLLTDKDSPLTDQERDKLIEQSEKLLSRYARCHGTLKDTPNRNNKRATYYYKNTELFRLHELMGKKFHDELKKQLSLRPTLRKIVPDLKTTDADEKIRLQKVEDLEKLLLQSPQFSIKAKQDSTKKIAGLLGIKEERTSYTQRWKEYLAGLDIEKIKILTADQATLVYSYIALSNDKYPALMRDLNEYVTKNLTETQKINLELAQLACQLNAPTKTKNKEVTFGSIPDGKTPDQYIEDQIKKIFSSVTSDNTINFHLDPIRTLRKRLSLTTSIKDKVIWNETTQDDALILNEQLEQEWIKQTEGLPQEWQSLSSLTTAVQNKKIGPEFLENFNDGGLVFLRDYLYPHSIIKARMAKGDDKTSKTFFKNPATAEELLSLLPPNASNKEKIDLLLRSIAATSKLGGPLQVDQIDMLRQMRRVNDKQVYIIREAGSGKSTMAALYNELFHVQLPFILHVAPFKENKNGWKLLTSLQQLSSLEKDGKLEHYYTTDAELAEMIKNANRETLRRTIGTGLTICDEFDASGYRIGTETIQNRLVKAGIYKVVNMSATDSDTVMLNRLNRVVDKFKYMRNLFENAATAKKQLETQESISPRERDRIHSLQIAIDEKSSKLQKLARTRARLLNQIDSEFKRKINFQNKASLNTLITKGIEKSNDLAEGKRSVLLLAPAEQDANSFATNLEGRLSGKNYAILYLNNDGKLMAKTPNGEVDFNNDFKPDENAVVFCLYTGTARGGNFGDWSGKFAGGELIFYPKGKKPSKNEFYQHLRRLRGDDRSLPCDVLLEGEEPLETQEEFIKQAEDMQVEIDTNNEVARLTEKVRRKTKAKTEKVLKNISLDTKTITNAQKLYNEAITEASRDEKQDIDWVNKPTESHASLLEDVQSNFAKKLEKYNLKGLEEQQQYLNTLQEDLIKALWDLKPPEALDKLTKSVKISDLLTGHMKTVTDEKTKKILEALPVLKGIIQRSQLGSITPSDTLKKSITAAFSTKVEDVKKQILQRDEALRLKEDLNTKLSQEQPEDLDSHMLDYDRKVLKDALEPPSSAS